MGITHLARGVAACIAIAIACSAGVPTAEAANGRTQGSFAVSPTGSSTYTIPVTVPAGPKGIQPNLALSYNSDAEATTLGVGWNLSGLSAVTRCPKTYVQDGVTAAVTLAVSDGYCLNGNRLRLQTGTYGTAGSTYFTEMESFAKVTAYGAAGNGPQYFIVQGKDGLTYEYGNSADSRVLPATAATTPYQWLLSKVSDRSGNSYKVTYYAGETGSKGVAVPQSIQYTPTTAGATTYNYTVNFAYTTRTAVNASTRFAAITKNLANSAVANGYYSIANPNLLSSISVSYGSTLIRKYSLAYETAATTTGARLKTVTECSGSAGADCYSPTTLTYQDGSTGANSSGVSIASSSYSFYAARDFNGDGKTDVLLRDTSYNLYVAMATGSGYGSPVSLGRSFTSPGTSWGPTIDFADLMGSGNTDILVPVTGSTWWRYSWNGTAMVGVSTGIVVNSKGDVWRDYNGDGLADHMYLTYTSQYSGYPSVYVRPNTSSGGSLSFGTASLGWQGQFGCTQGYWCNYHIRSDNPTSVSSATLSNKNAGFDINGDGKADMLLDVQTVDPWYNIYGYYLRLISTGASFSSIGTWVFTGTGTYGAVQANNDRCSDYIESQTITISSCNGASSSTAAFPYTSVGVADWDKDGRQDILVKVGSYVGIMYSQGTSFSAPVSTAVPYGLNAFILDANGDGLWDIGTVTSSGTSYYLHSTAGANPPDYLSSVTDGYGVTHSITYTTGNFSSGIATPVAPEQAVTDPIPVVGWVTTTDGVGGTYTKTYGYSGARRDIQGRGSLGFQTRTEWDSRANTPVVKTYYKTAFPYTGMVYQQDVYQNNGTTLISSTTNTLAVNEFGATGYNKRYFPYVSNTTTTTREVGGSKNGALITTSTASFVYDNYGNVTSSTTALTDNDSGVPLSPTYNNTWNKVVTNTFSPDTTNWCLGIPMGSTVQQSATGVSAITRTTSNPSIDYVKCRINQSVVEPNITTYKVTTDYGYDSFGNVKTVSITGKKPDGTDMAVRTTTTNWDTTGQFPINSTNAEGHYTQAGYNYSLGVQNSATDANGLVTTWAHDNFGRKLTESRPDGTSTTWTYNDCAGVAGGCQNGDPTSGATSLNKMVVIETTKDSGSTVISDSWVYLDQFDRTIVTKTKGLSGAYTRLGTQYNALGQAYRQTLPCDAASCSLYWSTTTFDALGRTLTISRPISASNATLQTTTIAYQGLTTVATDAQGKTKTRVSDPNGWLRKSLDDTGYGQSFTYDAFGSLKTVNDTQGNALFSANYAYGASAFQTQTADMDLGAWNYTLNALGEVTTYTDAKLQVFTMTYDKLSRPLTRFVSGEGTTTWTWGNAAASYNIGQLQSLTSTDGTTENYSYDNKSRLSQKAITADGTTYNYNYTYNTAGTLDTLTYPTSTFSYRLALKHVYQNGILQQVKDNAAGTVFWQANAANMRGQITQETLGNGIVTNRSYDAVTGWINSIQSGVGGGTGAQNEAYLFDKVGNVIQRQNNTQGLTESFCYDNVYRLVKSALSGDSTCTTSNTLTLNYDPMGRIKNRSDIAGGVDWTYDTAQKHALRQAGSTSFTYTYDANGNATTRNGQSITWSKYNYPTLINNSASENVAISYDGNNQRWKQVYVKSGATETTLYIGGLMEQVTDSTGTNYRHYIYGGSGSAAVAILSRKTTGTNATYYVLEDHQDSPSTIRDSSGNLVVNESHTAYGNRRNWSTWFGAANATELTTSANITRQGYTWQTALGSMGLNHMNGRVQDSVTGIFLSADPYVSEPLNTQNYNRYGYVYNNPLSLTDPSGFEVSARCEQMAGFYMSNVIGYGQSGSGMVGASGANGGSTLDSGAYDRFGNQLNYKDGWLWIPPPAGSESHDPIGGGDLEGVMVSTVPGTWIHLQSVAGSSSNGGAVSRNTVRTTPTSPQNQKPDTCANAVAANNDVTFDDVVDFSAGLGDALLLGFGDDIRGALDIGGVDMSSTSYEAGSRTSFGFGAARLTYAGLAKGYSLVASSGAAASAFRGQLKTAFRLGVGKNWRSPNLAGKTDAQLRRSAGKTNGAVNAYGAGVAAAGANGGC